MKAVFLDYATMGDGLDLSGLQALFSELILFEHSDAADIPARIQDAEFVFTNKVQLTDALIAAAPRLRYIGLTATGTDNIDLEAARRSGVAVANIRAYCTESVVEHVIGVLLMLTHNLHRYDASVKAGNWQRAQQFCMLTYPIRQLSNMTLGIVGYGDLGQGVAAAARAFGMSVVVAARPEATEIPASRVALEELLATADVISLHCPLTEQTRNLIDRDALARMRPGAILINTARGALVEAAALVDALRSGRIAAAAIDVLAEEPPVGGNPLLDYAGENLLITPHVAWATDQARQNAIDQLAAAAAASLAGEQINRVV
jgi:glycerate dehydrogenase